MIADPLVPYFIAELLLLIALLNSKGGHAGVNVAHIGDVQRAPVWGQWCGTAFAVCRKLLL